MTSIEKIDYAYRIMEEKCGKEQALYSIENYLNTLQSNYITRTNSARKIVEDFSFLDLFEILANYSIVKFVKDKMPITLSEEEISILGYDLEGKFNMHKKTAIEFFAVYNAINPYFAYNALACSKNIKPLLIKSLIEDRYNNPKLDILNADTIVKLITIKRNGTDVKYLMNQNNVHKMVEQTKKEEEEDYNFSK